MPQRGLEGRLAISRRHTSGAKSAWKAVFRPNVIRQENRMCHRESGIELFQIVLGLMCPGRLSGGGESQNEAKSRRFGMDMPSRAFYEGLIPKRFGTTLFWLLCGPSGRSVWHFSPCFPFPVFPMCHIKSGTNGFAERCSRERASGDARYSLLGKRFLRRLRIIQLRIHINSC